MHNLWIITGQAVDKLWITYGVVDNSKSYTQPIHRLSTDYTHPELEPISLGKRSKTLRIV